MAVQALGGIKYIFLTHQDDGELLPMGIVPTYHTTMPHSLRFQSLMTAPARR